MAPNLQLPASKITVSVSVINGASVKGIQASMMVSPQLPGHEFLQGPAYSFLIRHPGLDRALLFDLGVRKDWWNLAPEIVGMIHHGGWQIHVPKDVREVLEENGIDARTVEAVVWSHWHFDHTGDPSRFEKSTKLIVGPGFKEHLLPPYPVNKTSQLLESDFADREVEQLRFADDGPRIGQFRAVDYFGDGSFYLLDAPGHAIGHVAGFARVTSDPDSFIFMGGDACHHGGELRPSRHMPLPGSIVPNPLLYNRRDAPPCPGEIFESLLRDGDRARPFYSPATREASQAHFDPDETVRTIEKIQDLDVRDDVLVVMAHDDVLLDVMDFFPETANDFVRQGWVQQSRWVFLRDLAAPAGYTGEVVKGTLSERELPVVQR